MNYGRLLGIIYSLLWLSYTQASPSATHDTSQNFTVPIWTNPNALHPRNGLHGEALMEWASREAQKMHARYSHRNSSLEARQQVVLADYGADSFYFGAVQVGTPGKMFNVVLDTGSADFWIVGASCAPHSGCDASMQRYNASASSSSHLSNAPFHLEYGVGSVQGTMVSDTVSVAGYSVSSLAFAQASRLGQKTLTPPASGLMGLGFSSLSATNDIPLWQLLASKGRMEQRVFSFQLATNIDNTKGRGDVLPGGTMTLGRIDRSQFQGEISWTPVLPAYGSKGRGYWGVALSGLMVNGNNIALGSQSSAAIDTGTTLIGGPGSLVKQIYESIPGAKPGGVNMSQYYTYPCDSAFNVTLSFNNVPYTLTNDSLNLGHVSAGSKECVGAVFVHEPKITNAPNWIIGDSFLKTVYSVFSYEPELVGFARLPDQGVAKPSMTSLSTSVRSTPSGSLLLPSSTLIPAENQELPSKALPSPSVLSVPAGMHMVSSSATALRASLLSALVALVVAIYLVV